MAAKLKSSKMKLKSGLTYYKDKRGKIRWRYVSDNYRILGASSQGFKNRRLARENARELGYALEQDA